MNQHRCGDCRWFALAVDSLFGDCTVSVPFWLERAAEEEDRGKHTDTQSQCQTFARKAMPGVALDAINENFG